MNKLTITVVALAAAALVLTGCTSPETVETPKPVETSTVEPSTPTPSDTPEVPEAEELQDIFVTEKNSAGEFVLPSGETVKCDDGAQGVFLSEDGTTECDAGVAW